MMILFWFGWLSHSDARQVSDLPESQPGIAVYDHRKAYGRRPAEGSPDSGKSQTCRASEWRGHSTVAFASRLTNHLVRQNVVLENENHDKRELAKFIGPKFPAGEAVFFFPRLDAKGNPLIGPASRTVIISFDPRVFDWKKSTATKFKFDVARLVIDGKVAF
jgi:hypothetical protein